MKGLFKYPGSKNKAAMEIISYFPEHELYVEPFGGSAAVLRHKPPSRREIFNDIRGDIVNLFRVLAFDMERFLEKAEWLVNSRQLFYEFKEWVRSHPPEEDPVIHAVMTYYLLRFGFAGRRSGWGLNINQNSIPGIDTEYLRSVHERLRKVQFTNLDWKALVRKVDGKRTLFYMDPPYPGKGDLYGMHDWDHAEFEGYLRHIEGAWILSYPHQLEGWHCIPIEMQYSLKRRERVTEWLISNRPLKRQERLEKYI